MKFCPDGVAIKGWLPVAHQLAGSKPYQAGGLRFALSLPYNPPIVCRAFCRIITFVGMEKKVSSL